MRWALPGPTPPTSTPRAGFASGPPAWLLPPTTPPSHLQTLCGKPWVTPPWPQLGWDGEWESHRLAGGLRETGVGCNLDPRKSVRSRGKQRNHLTFGLCFPDFHVGVKQNSSLPLPTLVVLGPSQPSASRHRAEAPGAEEPSSDHSGPLFS